VSAFRIAPKRRPRVPRYPPHADFSPEELRRRPYRTGATRALAAALTALSAGAGAQGQWGFSASQQQQFTLLGDVAMMPQPMIAELIDPRVADTVINRLFADAGYPLGRSAPESKRLFRLDGWNEEHRVGFLVVDPGGFSSDASRVSYLSSLFEWDERLPDDPRGTAAWGNWNQTPTEKEQAEARRAQEMSQGEAWVRGEGPNGERVLCLDARDLRVLAHAPGQTVDPQSQVALRAEALQRLEGQVREFIDYLRSQGI
jgi:hypothetical protein